MVGEILCGFRESLVKPKNSLLALLEPLYTGKMLAFLRSFQGTNRIAVGLWLNAITS